jgi:murein DD-endopeptidase MepM/ murein hydrolase activator NlpD
MADQRVLNANTAPEQESVPVQSSSSHIVEFVRTNVGAVLEHLFWLPWERTTGDGEYRAGSTGSIGSIGAVAGYQQDPCRERAQEAELKEFTEFGYFDDFSDESIYGTAGLSLSHETSLVVAPPLVAPVARDRQSGAGLVSSPDGVSPDVVTAVVDVPVVAPLARADGPQQEPESGNSADSMAYVQEVMAFPWPVTAPVVRPDAVDVVPVAGTSPQLELPSRPPVERAPAALSERVIRERAGRTVREAVGGHNYLTDLLIRYGVTMPTIRAILDAARPVYNLERQLAADRKVTLVFSRDGLSLQSLSYPVNADRRVTVALQDGGGFVARAEEIPYEVRQRMVSGVVKGSFYATAQRAGISRQMARRLGTLFEWDVDMVHDLEDGDRFSVVYEEHVSDEDVVREGVIVAAELVSQGRNYQSVRYVDAGGRVDYYTPSGDRMRKMFIRTPVDFTAISSHFSSSRMHPILHYSRAHKGVDYSAPSGTPIRAAADGRVVFRDWYSGYGNFIVLEHTASTGRRYETAYGHLSAFASRVQVGETLRQGQLLGYVGMTGTATGPHLHYEVRINGQQVDPLTAQLPFQEPLSRQELARFKRHAGRYLAMLEQRPVQLAMHR